MDALTSDCKEVRSQTDLDPQNGLSSSTSSFLHRKIKFQPATKPFKALLNGSADFRIETLNPSSDARHPGSAIGQSTMGGKKPDVSDLFESGFDPELSFGITVRKIGASLENLGNTCFLNSVLQCLTYTEPLAAYLQSGKHRNSCHIAGFCALCAIQKHVSRALQATGRILAPKDLVSNLRCISRNFRNARQEDAHEYMVNLLESMHKCCLPSGVPSESASAYEKSLVHKIFGGRLRSQVKCQQCNHCSNTFDPFLDLSLDIFKADSLHKAFVNFTNAELLDGGGKEYKCEKCNQKVRALKQLTVYKAPHVLNIHLKRFRAHDPGKIDKKVQFGSTLDMKPFVSGSYEGDLKYTLYGVLVHYGWSIHSGHYYCFVRTSSGMWYSLDDNRVVQVNERTVLEQKAYMLFYVRDRKNVVPKKPIDVLQKENLKAKITVNKPSPFPDNSKAQVPNGSTENKLGGADPSATMIQKNAANGQMTAKLSQPKEDPVAETTLVAPLSNSSSEVPSVLKPDLIISQSSAPCLNNNLNTSNLTTSAGAQASKCNEDGNSRKRFQVSVSESPNCNSSHISVTAKLVTEVTLQRINCISDAQIPNITPSAADDLRKGRIQSAGSVYEKINLPSPNKRSCESSQVATTSVVNATGKLLSDENDDSAEKLVRESVDFPTPVGITNGSLERKSSDRALHKRSKKLLKCQVRNMRVGLKFFLVSLGLHKKGKHKRSKRRTLDVKNAGEEVLLEQNSYSSDLGPSTAGTSRTVSVGSTHSRRKVDCGGIPSGERKCNGSSLMDDTVQEFRERICHSGSELLTHQPSEKNFRSVSDGSQHETREVGFSSKKSISPNAMLQVLTRGLEETVGIPSIAPWDDVDLPPKIAEPKSENVNIGYVLDEWDEEYDRGKRKKVRQHTHSFGGPNPFQELAVKKSQFKKTKISHRNVPFRI